MVSVDIYLFVLFEVIDSSKGTKYGAASMGNVWIPNSTFVPQPHELVESFQCLRQAS